jgi:hypothetical protein
MEYEGLNKYTSKSTLGFGIDTRWMKGLMMVVEMVMMKVDVATSKI